MDRQSLLEQKRQRLQELKSRRLNQSSQTSLPSPSTSTSTNNEIEDLVEKLQVLPKVTKSIAVQTEGEYKKGLDSTFVDDTNYETENKHVVKDKITFDKGIQTIGSQEDDHEYAEIEGKDNENSKADINYDVNEEENVVTEENLNQTLGKSLKTLNKLLIQDSNETDYFIDKSKSKAELNSAASEASAFRLAQIVPGVAGRPVVTMDIPKINPNLMVISYGMPTSAQDERDRDRERIDMLDQKISQSFEAIKNSPGLAVVYSIEQGKEYPYSVPEYYLLTTSSITSIKFDASNASKIIGGLNNGKVVIWEIQGIENSIVLLPSLVSPILSSSSNSLIRRSGSSDAKSFHNHTHPITSVAQVDSSRSSEASASSSTAITASLDGVINLWSTSILASPRADSVQLYKPSNDTFSSLKDKLPITCMFLLNSDIMSSQQANSTLTASYSGEQSEEHKFLNEIVVGSQDGNLYKLSNHGKQTNFIQMVSERKDEEDENSQRTSVSSISELNVTNRNNPHLQRSALLATAGMEWGYNLWNAKANSIEHLVFVHTDHVILQVISRPNKELQFITLGLGTSPVSILSFWDLRVKLMNPMVSVELPNEYKDLIPTSLKFSHEGDKLYVGFDKGTVFIWDLDDTKLQDLMAKSANPNIDNGINSILHLI